MQVKLSALTHDLYDLYRPVSLTCFKSKKNKIVHVKMR